MSEDRKQLIKWFIRYLHELKLMENAGVRAGKEREELKQRIVSSHKVLHELETCDDQRVMMIKSIVRYLAEYLQDLKKKKISIPFDNVITARTEMFTFGLAEAKAIVKYFKEIEEFAKPRGKHLNATTILYGKWMGQKTITIPLGIPMGFEGKLFTFTFGIKKAKRVVKYFKEIEEFALGNEETGKTGELGKGTEAKKKR